MVSVISGNVNGIYEYVVKAQPIQITSRLLMNMSGSDITANVSISFENTIVGIIPKDYQILSGEGSESDTPIIAVPRSIIRIQSSGKMDFYFSVENITDNA